MRLVMAAMTLAVFPGAALAGKMKEVPASVCVEDPDGVPIATARLRVVEEGPSNHLVNTVSGCWTSSAIYNDLGSWVPFVKGTVLNLVVSAPGYAPQELSWMIAPSGLTVALSPIPDTVDFERLGIDPEAVLERPLTGDDLERMAVEAADLMRNQDHPAALAQAERTLALSPEGGTQVVALAVRAHSETALWRQACEARAAEPSQEAAMAAYEASRRVVAASRAWLAAVGPHEAVVPRGLCVAATLDRGECEPWEQELWPEASD